MKARQVRSSRGSSQSGSVGTLEGASLLMMGLAIGPAVKGSNFSLGISILG
jgi:hypothetical protein